MLQIRTTINGELRYLDLYGDEDVKIDIAFAEVQDITKKNSNFSESFKVPGSKNNNDIFNHFYEFDASMIDYDPRQKFDCEMMLDGISVYSGYLRLNGSTRDKEEVIYDVTFYSEVGNLVANIGDKMLADIDFSNLSHTYSKSIILSYARDSSSYIMSAATQPYTNGKIYYALLSKGYQYTGQTFDETGIDYTDTTRLDFIFEPSTNTQWPLGKFGYMTNFQTPVQWYYLTPSLQVKEIYDRIYTGSGYNVQSEFMETDYFKSYYLPLTFNDDNIFLSSTVDPSYGFESAPQPPLDEITGLTSYVWTETFPPPPSTTNSARIPCKYVFEDNFQATLTDNAFKLTTPGYYKFRITFSAYNSELYPETVPLDAQGQFYLRYSEYQGFDTGTTLTFTSGDTKYTSPTITLGEGQQITNYSITSNFFKYSSNEQAFAWDVKRFLGVGDFVVTRFRFEILEGPRQIPGGVFNPQDEFPVDQYKQMDFIASINQFFNMVTVPIPGDPKTLRVEPVIDFVGKGETLDWSDKVNRDEPIKVEPLTDIIEGTLNYMYEEDDSWGNETYTKANNHVFGDRNVQLNLDYKDKDTDFETEFGSSVDRVLGSSPSLDDIEYATNPIYFQRKDREDDNGEVVPEFNPYRTTPKLLFKGFSMPVCTMGDVTFQGAGGNIYDGEPFWVLDDQYMSYWRSQNRFTTYPFGLNQYSHYTNWSDDIFDKNEETYLGSETLYDVFWKEYIDDLTDEDNRLVTMEMYFDPFELANLKFDEKINVDNTLFRINNIKNYSLVNKGLAEVELIKLTREYEPHRKIYYTATPCPGSECDIIFSNSDLQTNLFAYCNKYFKHKVTTTGGNDCGCFYLTYSYDPPVGNVTYQPILVENGLGAGGTVGGNYQLFDSCSDCNNGPTNVNDCLNVFNDITPTPSPLPPTPTPSTTPPQSPLPVTPTPTPTITPSTTPDCVCRQYTIINETLLTRSYSYRDCTTGDNIFVPTLPPQTGALICACQNSVRGRYLTITDVGDCPDPGEPTPTPTETETPTPTPTSTLTPTPTPTPGGGTPTDFDVCNNGPVDITVAYVECATGNLITAVVPAGECLDTCACSDIAFVGPSGAEDSMVVQNTGPCSLVCDYMNWNPAVSGGTGTTIGCEAYSGTPGPTNNGIMYRMTSYSGGTLLGAYYSGPALGTLPNLNNALQYLADYNNYTRNTLLNGRYPQVFVRTIIDVVPGLDTSHWMVYNATEDNWIIVEQTNFYGTNPYNPIFMGGLGTQVTTYQGNEWTPGEGWPSTGINWTNDGQPTWYPPTTGYQAGNDPDTDCEFTITYGTNGECVDLAPTPTPTPYGGTPTPTPTPSVTASQTPTPTPTITPSSTPDAPSPCTLYGISNLDLLVQGSVKYTDCEGNKQANFVPANTSIQICAQTGSVTLSTTGDMVSIALGDCS